MTEHQGEALIGLVQEVVEEGDRYVAAGLACGDGDGLGDGHKISDASRTSHGCHEDGDVVSGGEAHAEREGGNAAPFIGGDVGDADAGNWSRCSRPGEGDGGHGALVPDRIGGAIGEGVAAIPAGGRGIDKGAILIQHNLSLLRRVDKKSDNDGVVLIAVVGKDARGGDGKGLGDIGQFIGVIAGNRREVIVQDGTQADRVGDDAVGGALDEHLEGAIRLIDAVILGHDGDGACGLPSRDGDKCAHAGVVCSHDPRRAAADGPDIGNHGDIGDMAQREREDGNLTFDDRHVVDGEAGLTQRGRNDARGNRARQRGILRIAESKGHAAGGVRHQRHGDGGLSLPLGNGGRPGDCAAGYHGTGDAEGGGGIEGADAVDAYQELCWCADGDVEVVDTDRRHGIGVDDGAGGGARGDCRLSRIRQADGEVFIAFVNGVRKGDHVDGSRQAARRNGERSTRAGIIHSLEGCPAGGGKVDVDRRSGDGAEGDREGGGAPFRDAAVANPERGQLDGSRFAGIENKAVRRGVVGLGICLQGEERRDAGKRKQAAEAGGRTRRP